MKSVLLSFATFCLFWLLLRSYDLNLDGSQCFCGDDTVYLISRVNAGPTGAASSRLLVFSSLVAAILLIAILS